MSGRNKDFGIKAINIGFFMLVLIYNKNKLIFSNANPPTPLEILTTNLHDVISHGPETHCQVQGA